MCGICGEFALIGDPDPGAARAEVRRMTAMMVRRGPDDEGFWSDETCALGFRRLSILDLSPAGHQPMVSACGNFVLIFNGEVYNYRELRLELEAKGFHFRSDGDTEVVLGALSLWGEAALPKFNGMFALACYDRRNRSVLLARDPLGIKPLYYLVHREGLAFASQYDQLIAHRWCDRSRVDPEVMGLYLRLGYIPAPYGLLPGTKQVEPGHWLRFTVGGATSGGSYYQFGEGDSRPLVGGEAAEAVHEAVMRSVRRQMVSDVPVGAFLSGGVDSPLVAGLMQAISPQPVPSVTIGTTDPALDESDVARAYARQLALDHTVRMFDDRAALEHIDEVTAAYGEPFADSSAFPSLLLSKVTRERVTVALSGDGGDEVFWGYPRFLKTLRARSLFHLPRPARTCVYAGARLTRRAWPPSGVRYPTLGAWYLSGQSGLHTRDLEQICPRAASIPRGFQTYRLDRVPSEAGLAQWMRTAELECHLPMILIKMDRASMHYGLEVRVPLLDLEVLQVAARIPHTECIRDGVGKQPLRAALGRLVDQDVIPTRKAGFSIPMTQWLRGVLRPRVEELLLDRDPYPNGFFDRKALRALYESHLRGHDRHRGLWTLLALQLWADRHVTRMPAAEVPDRVPQPKPAPSGEPVS